MRRGEPDLLGHRHFAAELAAVVAAADEPTNIALYGRWGSGKTGVQTLLEEELQQIDPKVKLVRFDAFKWVETPLRRQFLSQLAARLGVEDEQFGHDLYATTKTNTLKVPAVTLLKLVGVFLAIFGLIALGVGALAALVALLREGVFLDEWERAVRWLMTAGSIPAALLAAFLTLTGRAIPVERTTEAPSSEEQFERLFKQLVREAKKNGLGKLVVFIDELDRCSAKEVVSTLETMKTFLEVDNCVFIVAADQQVLEQALTARARQETPADPTNPYYSAGSSYLDKIFHYQLALPPVLPRRLSSFALQLVEGLPGVWEQVDAQEVVSVLVPTHVTSPRRVKTLLNNFVLTYRLAERRAAEGMLPDNLPERAAELAKLVCLRTEFPLFAADLHVDPRLTGLVHMLHHAPDSSHEGVPDYVLKLAESYAKGSRPVAQLLPAPSDATQDLIAEVDEEEGQDDGDEAAPTDFGQVRTVQRAHTQQLIVYLDKTATVPDPAADLVFLESGGAAEGVDAVLASQLETAAVNAQSEHASKLLAGLQSAERTAAVRLLAHRTRESVGVEGRNATATLLRVAADLKTEELEAVAGPVADAVAAHQARYQLTDDDLIGAWRLGVIAARQAGSTLAAKVLANPAALTVPRLGLAILAQVEAAARLQPQRTSDVVAARLADPETAREAGKHLAALDDRIAAQLLAAASSRLTEQYKLDEGATDEEQSALYDAAAEVIDELCVTGHKAAPQQMARALLAVNSQGARDRVEARLPDLAPVSDVQVAVALLHAAQRRKLPRWPKWLSAIDTAAAPSITAQHIHVVAAALWRKVLSLAEPDEADSAAVELHRLVEAGATWDPGPVQDGLAEALAPPLATARAVDAVNRAATAAAWLAERGLAEPDIVAESIQAKLCEIAGYSVSVAQGAVGELETLLRRWGRWVAERTSDEGLRRVLDAVEQSPWLPEPTGQDLRLLIAAAGLGAGADPGPVATPDQLRDLVSNYAEEIAGGLGDWLAAAGATMQSSELWHVAGPVAGDLPEPIARGLRVATMALSPAAKLELVRPSIAGLFTAEPSPEFLRAARFDECDTEAAVDMFVDLFDAAEKNPDREKVLRLLQELKAVSDPARKRIVEQILLPLATLNQGGTELAVRYVSLGLPPPYGTKQRLSATLHAQAKEHPDRERLERRLQEAGLLRGKGLLGFRGRRPVDNS